MRGRKDVPADAILSADWHLREDVPACRTDDFLGAQFDKLAQLAVLQRKNDNCPVLVAGDVFHHWKPSPALLRAVIDALREFPGPIVCVPGQHDLPQHSLEQYHKSGLAVLEAAGVIQVLGIPLWDEWINDVFVRGIPFGYEPKAIDRSASFEELERASNVALIHRLVYPDRPPFPGAEASGGTAAALLRQMGGFDLVVSGDNHQTFVFGGGTDLLRSANDSWVPGDKGDPVLVNPGPLTRQAADTAEHEPSVFLWWARENRVQRHVLRYNEGAVSREHLDRGEARDERMEAFARHLRDGGEVGLSFEDNLRRTLAASPVRKPVEQLIWSFIEKEKK